MPFKSEAQRRFLHKFHPKMAKRWDKKEASGKYRPTGRKSPVDSAAKTPGSQAIQSLTKPRPATASPRSTEARQTAAARLLEKRKGPIGKAFGRGKKKDRE